MKLIAVLVAIMALALTSVAVASSDDVFSRAASRGSDSTSTYKSVDTTKIRAVTSLRLPALKLPDYKGLTWKLRHTDRKWLAPQLAKSRAVVSFFTSPKRSWMLATKREKCWEVPWQRQCTIARAKLRLNHALAEIAEYRLHYELPLINDWRTAVRYVQRIYPGTESWMLFISDREGGWGRWVWYGGRTWSGYHVGNDFLGADTVGGWMQFRFSTFAPYYRGMLKDMRSRGYKLPEWPNLGGPSIYQPWLSPLAQALTAGYMKYYGKEGCHWCL